jgi:hypothetical protein
MPFADDTTALIPTPYPNFILYAFISFAYLGFLPLLYVGSYMLFRKGVLFAPLVLGLAVVLAALDALWIASNWERGLDYPGADFTRAVASENAMAFTFVIALASIGWIRRSRILTARAHLLLFIVLGWCAFPLLGRFDL